MDKPDLEHEESQPFNMAIATLMRLDNILQKIRDLSLDRFLSQAEKQERKLELLKYFYINSVVLLKNPEEFLDVLDLSMKELPVFSKIEGKELRKQNIYDPELDKLINKKLVIIQTKLQEEKVFMPSKRDPRFAWDPNR